MSESATERLNDILTCSIDQKRNVQTIHLCCNNRDEFRFVISLGRAFGTAKSNADDFRSAEQSAAADCYCFNGCEQEISGGNGHPK